MAVRALLAIVAMLAACLAHGQTTRAQAYQRARDLQQLGRKMFFDPALSASGKSSCATCHDPAFAYGPPNDMPVQPAGKDLQQWGRRAVPSLRYLQSVPPFSEHYFDADSGDESIDAGPTGGLTWDGRVDRGRDQARLPLLSFYEMANENTAAVVASVERSTYAADFRRLLGTHSTREAQFNLILEALETWQQTEAEFYPYSSKYDRYLAGRARLTDQESRGLKLFTDPEKGNCARCHIATRGATGTPPQFTDYAFVALGLPRNPHVPANMNRAWFDLGLCGPERLDLQSRDEYCGRFMTPTLRNVALRQTFFHNGMFHTLKEAVQFYALRDTNPEKFYPKSAKFNDLPPKYHANIEHDPPFGPRTAPALTDQDIDDIVAFLNTLTDGYRQ